ncbi:alkyl sulfatase BDS1-like metallo-beta-lactamase superfamily hydrolase [Thermobifida halotolerans]
MSHPSSYSKPVQQTFSRRAPRGDSAQPPEPVPVEGTSVWNLRAANGSLVNCVVIEGPDGLVLLGSGRSPEQGRAIARTLAARFDKPVEAVILGEPVSSHCTGVEALLKEQRNEHIPVIAHESWGRHPEAPLREIIYLKVTMATLQYGSELWETDDLPQMLRRALTDSLPPAPHIAPTVTVRHGEEVSLAGLRIRCFSTGLFFDASLGLHLPQYRTAVIANDFHATPGNFMAIEGARAEVSASWHALLTHLSTMDLQRLASTRMEPLLGTRRIRDMLSTYLDAIDYLHDQTVRHILSGAPADEIAHQITLPEEVLKGPFSRPLHGNFTGSALQHHSRYVGWFSGNAVDLAPTPRAEHARRSIALMGGQERVLAASAEALDGGDPQWAAELARLVVAAGPEDEAGRAALSRALHALGDQESNPLRRNWYHCAAMDASGDLRLSDVRDAVKRLFPLPAHVLLENLRFRVIPEQAGDRTVSIGVEMSDTGEQFGLLLRNSVLRVHEGVPPEWLAGMRLSTEALTRLVLGEVSLTELVSQHEVEIQGVPDAVEELWEAIGPRPELSFHRR